MATLVWIFMIYALVIKITYCQSIYDLSPEQAANLVRDEFRHGYEAYIDYAWGSDELRPLTFDGLNWSDSSMMITPIDSLGTMAIMGLQDLLNRTLDELLCDGETPKFSFLKDQNINMFEIVIRDLGGLVSAYHFVTNEIYKQCIKSLAIELGDAIYETTFNGIDNVANIPDLPWIDINILTKTVNTNWNSFAPAGLASNIIEFGALSYIADDDKYYVAAKNTMRKLYDLRSNNTGLVGAEIAIMVDDITDLNALWPDNSAHIDAQIDSYYEYMIKCYELFKDEECLKWWNDALISIYEYLQYIDEFNNIWFQRVDWNNGTIFGPNNTRHNSFVYTLHAHFMAATLTLTDNQIDLDIAIANQEANQFMWDIQGITPFVYDFDAKKITSPQYDLNPEIFESNYYLYVKTRDPLYFNRTYQYMDALLTYTKCINNTECAGYSSIENVTTMERKNVCPSFWFAESLKFLYLTFMEEVDDNPFNFDDYIFNTEAHPVPKAWFQTTTSSTTTTSPTSPPDDLSTGETDLTASDIWAFINLYVFSIITVAISVYMMILIFCTKLTKKSRYAIDFDYDDLDDEQDNFENDKIDDKEWKASYYSALYSFFAMFCLLITTCIILFFQTDALIEWEYDSNNDQWQTLKWSYIAMITLYFFGKILIFFTFSFSVNSNSKNHLLLWSRILIIFCLIILIIIQIILNDEFIIKDIIYNNDDFMNRIQGITVDDPTDAVFCVVLVLLYSIVIIMVYLKQFKELKSVQQAASPKKQQENDEEQQHKATDLMQKKSSTKIYLLSKDWLLLCIYSLSSWIFMILWLTDLPNRSFFLPCIDLMISSIVLCLLYYYHERVYQTICKYCHFGCSQCIGIQPDSKTFTQIKRLAAKNIDIRSDPSPLIPLDEYQQYGITNQ